jgi:hypothetical protein
MSGDVFYALPDIPRFHQSRLDVHAIRTEGSFRGLVSDIFS